MYIYIFIYICTHMYTHVYLYTRAHTQIHTHDTRMNNEHDHSNIHIPKSGNPILDMCAPIWCARPVCSRSLTSHKHNTSSCVLILTPCILRLARSSSSAAAAASAAELALPSSPQSLPTPPLPSEGRVEKVEGGKVDGGKEEHAEEEREEGGRIEEEREEATGKHFQKSAISS